MRSRCVKLCGAISVDEVSSVVREDTLNLRVAENQQDGTRIDIVVPQYQA